MRRRSLGATMAHIVALLVCLCALTLGACAQARTTSQREPVPDSQQVFHTQFITGSKDVATLDPAYAQDPASRAVIQLIFPGLVTLDENLNVVPWAATGMPTISGGGTVYTFHIRRGLTFTDGEPIDASAFAYAINRSLDPCVASPANYYLFALKDATTFTHETCFGGRYKPAAGQTGPLLTTLIGDALTIVDPQTLIITLASPAANFLATLTNPTSYAVPRNLIKQYGNLWTNQMAGMRFSGNLFRVIIWNHTGEIKLLRNDHFWGTKPRLREVIFAIFSDAQNAYLAYTTRAADQTFPPPSQLAAAHQQGDLHTAPLLWTDYLQPNWNVAPFNDLRARQAFDLALDRTRLAQSALGGAVTPTYHLVPQGAPGYNAALTNVAGGAGLAGDVAKARTLLQAYAADHCGGVLSACPSVTLTTPNTPNGDALARAVVAMWRSAFPGYPITLQSLDYSVALTQVARGQTQLFIFDWAADYPDPQDWLSLQFLPGSSVNAGQVNLPAANALMQAADVNLDQQRRMRQYNEAEQLLVTNVARMTLDQRQVFYELRPYIVGYMTTADGVPLTVYQRMYVATS